MDIGVIMTEYEAVHLIVRSELFRKLVQRFILARKHIFLVMSQTIVL